MGPSRRDVLKGVLAYGLGSGLSVAGGAEQEGLAKVSLHNHSVYSDGSYHQNDTLDNLIPAALQKGVQVLAITDCNRDAAFDELLKDNRGYKVDNLSDRVLVVEKNEQRVCLVRGIEYHQPEGHVVALGSDQTFQMPEDYSVADVVKSVRDQGGIAIVAHPMIVKYGGMGAEKLFEVKDEIDALEIFNAQMINFIPFLIDARGDNTQALEFARQYDLAGIAVSDSKDHSNIDKAYFKMPEEMVDLSGGVEFVEGLRKALDLTKGNYEKYNHCEYNSWGDFFSWAVWPRHKGKIIGAGVLGLLGAEGVRRLIKRRKKIKLEKTG